MICCVWLLGSYVYFIHKHRTANSAPATSLQQEVTEKNLGFYLSSLHLSGSLICEKQIACLLTEGICVSHSRLQLGKRD